MVDGIITATGQTLGVPKGLEALAFRMVTVVHKGARRVVALEAFDPADGHSLGIRIQGAQMAKAAPLVFPASEQAEFTSLMNQQATDQAVPRNSRGVLGSINQNGIDIELANAGFN